MFAGKTNTGFKIPHLGCWIKHLFTETNVLFGKCLPPWILSKKHTRMYQDDDAMPLIGAGILGQLHQVHCQRTEQEWEGHVKTSTPKA
jgi:hypothetical protein